jgi:hypothetical protein
MDSARYLCFPGRTAAAARLDLNDSCFPLAETELLTPLSYPVLWDN